MASYISGSINFQGLGSGTDFGSIISQLKKIESIPMQRLELWKADWQTRYESFGLVLDSIREAKATLGGMNSLEKFVSKIGTSSAPTTATLTATGKAVDGTHSIDVKQLAGNAVWSYDGDFSSRNDAVATANTSFSYTYKGKTRAIQIAANTGLESFVNMINNDPQNLGIRASVVQSGSKYTLQIQGKETGTEATLSIAPAAGLKFLSDPNWKSAASYTADQVIWSGPGKGEFKFALNNGTAETFELESGATMQNLLDEINARHADSASLNADGKLVIKGATTVKGPAAKNVIDVPWWRSTNSYGATDPVIKNWQSGVVTPSASVWRSDSAASLDDPVHSGSAPASFNFTVNGTQKTVVVASGAKLSDVAAAINSAAGKNIASVEAVDPDDPTQGGSLKIIGATQAEFSGLTDAADTPTTLGGTVSTEYSADASFHNGGANAKLTYQINGVAGQLAIKPGSSLNDIAAQINKAGFGNVATVQPVNASDPSQGYTLNIAGADFVKFEDLKSGPASGDPDIAFTGAQAEGSAAYPQKFDITVKGTTYSFDIVPGKTTAQDLADAINAACPPEPGMEPIAALEDDPKKAGNSIIRIAGASAAVGLAGKSTVATDGMKGDFEYGGWAVTQPRNAVFMLDNWPNEMESSTNNVSGMIDGATINLIDTGKAQLSINTDMTSVRDNLQKFLDTINSVRKAVMELTKVSSDTEYQFSKAKKYDPNDPISVAAAQKQKGSSLTGNYGVQLLDSRMKTIAAGMPPGFEKIMGDDLLSGDLISSLSQLGIKTITDKDDPDYGLLAVAPASDTAGMQDMDMKKYEDALANSLEAVLNFLATDDAGSSSSADFRYASHIKGGTKAGTYNVSYTVSYPGGEGSDPEIKVFIDGKEAKRDTAMDGYWFTSSSGASAGLAVQIDNLNAGEHTGKVSIKQGKIREMEDFFGAELKDDYAGSVSSTNSSGALVILQKNYTDVMKNINAKIEREQTRLANWERRQKLAYARLDTLLAQYSANQSRLESEIAKLGPGVQ